MTLLGFVGGVLVDRADPPSVFGDARDVLAATDVLFGNCECPYGTTPTRRPPPACP